MVSEREPSGFACQSCGKDFSDHLGLVGTCAQLTAAQQQLTTAKQWIDQLSSENGQLQQRVGELEQRQSQVLNVIREVCNNPSEVALGERCAKLTAENARLKTICDDLAIGSVNVDQEAKQLLARIKETEEQNARLRELLRECSTYELMPDAYELRDKIDAELAKGE